MPATMPKPTFHNPVRSIQHQPSPQNDDALQLMLLGQAHEQTEELEAYYALEDTDGTTTEAPLGKLNIISYNNQLVNVYLVPVDGADVNQQAVSNILNDIYSPAVTQWNVTVTPSYQNPNWDGEPGEEFADGGTAFLSNYTSDMNRLIRHYRRNHDIERNAYYIFIAPYPTEGSRSGYMPFDKQYGFVFTQNSGTSTGNLARTIAHELGHGAFNLRHTFSTHNDYIINQGTTNNLMDYTGGTELWKYQWDYIHNPEGGLYLFEDEEEMAMYDHRMSLLKIKEVLENMRDANVNNEELLNPPYIISKGTITDLELGGYTLDYLSMNIGRGKHTNYEDNPLEFDRLKINPGEINSQETETPDGQSGEFVKYTFNRYDEQTNIPMSEVEYIASDEIGMEIVIREEDVDDFEMYLFGEKESDSDKIIINIVTTLIDENEYNTFSSFSIDNGAVTGYFIEREPGTYEEERERGEGKRIPGNTYEFIEDPCKTERSNCENEFRLITIPEKSGTRVGILIHTGVDYNDTRGCLITAGDNYTYEEVNIKDENTGEIIETLKIFNTNRTSAITLNKINAYVEQKKQKAEEHDKTLKMYISINR